MTGANRGIGLEVVGQLARRGFDVFLGSRDLARGQAVAGQIAEVVIPLALDVTDLGSVTAAAETLRQQAGHLDVLVNNAAVHYDTWQRAESADFAVVSEALEVSLLGARRTTQALPLLRRSDHGRIVNVSSGAGS